MLPFSRFTDYMKLMLLAMTVAAVSLMNQRQVAVMQYLPVAANQQDGKKINAEETSRKTIVYQKVCFEATPSLAIPLPDIDLAAILPVSFSQPVLAVAEHFLPLTGCATGIPAAVAGILGSAILTRAP